jgi:iron complex transport system ATP-binding protein
VRDVVPPTHGAVTREAGEPVAATPDGPLLELRDATVVRRGRRVLHEVSLRLELGEHTAILGPNGCGKSTLVKLVTGELYPLANEGGTPPVQVLGRARWNLQELRSRFGVISSDLHHRLIGGSSLGKVRGLEAVVASFFASEVVFMHHPVTEDLRDRARVALARVGGEALAARRMDEMSSGEARRVLIARALVHEPAALVLDEPTSGLDPVARLDFLATLRRLAGLGTTLILVTHHVEEVLPETRRVVLLRRGRVLADGPTSEVLTAELLSKAFGRDLDVRRRNGRYELRLHHTREEPDDG